MLSLKRKIQQLPIIYQMLLLIFLLLIMSIVAYGILFHWLNNQIITLEASANRRLIECLDNKGLPYQVRDGVLYVRFTYVENMDTLCY